MRFSGQPFYDERGTGNFQITGSADTIDDYKVVWYVMRHVAALQPQYKKRTRRRIEEQVRQVIDLPPEPDLEPIPAPDTNSLPYLGVLALSRRETKLFTDCLTRYINDKTSMLDDVPMHSEQLGILALALQVEEDYNSCRDGRVPHITG